MFSYKMNVRSKFQGYCQYGFVFPFREPLCAVLAVTDLNVSGLWIPKDGFALRCCYAGSQGSGVLLDGRCDLTIVVGSKRAHSFLYVQMCSNDLLCNSLQHSWRPTLSSALSDDAMAWYQHKRKPRWGYGAI